MSRVVWKFEIDLADRDVDYGLDLQVPVGTELLYATNQFEKIVVYALVDLEAAGYSTRRIYAVGTGNSVLMEPRFRLRPLGVASLYGGGEMWHIFERRVADGEDHA